MVYSSVVFIFYLMFALAGYSALPIRLRVFGLFLISTIWFISWGKLWCAVMLLINIGNFFVLNYSNSVLAQRKVILFRTLIGFNVFVFVTLKTLPHFNMPTAYGLSFYYLTLLGLIIDRSREKANGPPRDFFSVMLFPNFFATLMAGPILRWKNFASQLQFLPAIKKENLVDGCLIYSYGFIKINTLGRALELFESHLWNEPSLSPGQFFLAAFLATARAYIDFSSYCDMGRGVAKIFGLQLPANFTPFYYAKNPSDFWQRWNITLGTWIRDYVSFPAMLRWGRKVGQNSILVLSFVLVGLWHGISWNWFAFGLYNGLLIALFAWVQNRWNLRYPYVVKSFGYLSVFILYFGNGILQNTQAFSLFNKLDVRRNFLAYDFSYLTTSLLCFLALFLVIEYLQEKKNDLDFYLKIPQVYKDILSAAAVGFFFYLLYQNQLLEEPVLPPLYFRF